MIAYLRILGHILGYLVIYLRMSFTIGVCVKIIGECQCGAPRFVLQHLLVATSQILL